ncbi:MAG: hypothetical protein IPH75_13185 [bacterium]|nr:hypothetical protein [bacterium]
MKRINLLSALALLLVAGSLMAANPKSKSDYSNGSASSPTIRAFTGQVLTGYYAGVGLHCSGTLNHFAVGFPFSVRFGLGYARVATGDAVAARRIFIDNNTNGSPRGWAKLWDTRLDVLYPVKIASLQYSNVYGGVRHAYYNSHFEYIGGNETFDVTTNAWGLGGGLESSFPVSPRVSMLFTVGADYYFRSELSGHDTYYRPNGDDLHAKEDYTYDDADAAIAQPDVEVRLMFGVSYKF